MAGNDTAALVVAMSAQLDRFQKDMDSAAGMADKATRQIEDRFKKINPGVQFVDELQSKLLKLGSVAGLGELAAQMQALVEQTAKLGEAAQRVGVSTDYFQKFQYAIVATGGSTEAAAGFLDTFSRKIAEAANGSGDLYNFLKVNNVALHDASGQLLPLNVLIGKYADLVKNTKSSQDQLNEAFLVAGRQAGPQVVAALKLGSDGIKQFGDDATKAGVVIDREVIDRARRINEEYQKLKLQFTTTAQEISVSTWDLLSRSIINVAGGLKEFVNQIEAVQRLKDKAAAAKPFDLEAAGMMDVPGVGPVPTGLPGQAPAKITVHPPEPLSARERLGVTPPDVVTPGDDSTKQFQKQEQDFQKLLELQNQHILLLGAEQSAIGLTVGQATALKTQIELETQARKENIPLTNERKQAIADEAAKIGAAAQALDDYKRHWVGVNSAVQFAGDEMIDVMDGLRNHTLTASQAVTQLANAFIHATEQALLLGSGPLANILGTQSGVAGGTGGLLGGLVGLFKGGGSGAGAAAAGNAAVGDSGLQFARGGQVSGPGSGTSDDVFARLSNGEFVMNAEAAKMYGPMLAAMNSGAFPRFAAGGPVPTPEAGPEFGFGEVLQ